MIKAAALFLLLACPANAGPDRISFMLGSSHVGAMMSYEEINPGVFATWEDRALGLDYSLGIYRNSFGRASVAATAALPLVKKPRFQADVFAGVALYPGNGKDFAYHAGDVVPIAGLQARLGNGYIQIMPGDGMTVVAFGLTFPTK